MKELGFDGSTLENLVAGAVPKASSVAAPVAAPAVAVVTAEPIEPKNPA